MTADEREGALPLDGNAAAGLLREVFACEMTVAIITCGGCGAAAPVGAARVFGGAMGAIFRCTASARRRRRNSVAGPGPKPREEIT
jgi:Family of unknown function (DUF6510)